MMKWSSVVAVLLCLRAHENYAFQPHVRLTTTSSWSVVGRHDFRKGFDVVRRATNNKRGGGTTLSMHMGHSHSHSHGHGHDHKVDGLPPVTAKGWRGALQRLTRRRTSRVVFAAVVVLGTPLVRRHRCSRADLAVFLLLSTVLSFADAVRAEARRVLTGLRDLKEGMARHSPPAEPREGSFFTRRRNAADRVTILGAVINLALSVGKAAVGVTCRSSALVADAGHSLSDLFSDFITLWAVRVARLPPDEDHPYGHGKFEAIGSLFLALTLLGTGVSVGSMSTAHLWTVLTADVGSAAAAPPSAPALVAAAASIASKEWLFRVTRRVAEETNNRVVLANAWHHRSDAYSSVLALVCVALAVAVPGLVAADAVAGALVAGTICGAGAEILGESVAQLTDTSDGALVRSVEEAVAARFDEDVVKVRRVRARSMGSSGAIVDVAVDTPEGLSATATRSVEERVRAAVHRDVDRVDAVHVHATEAETVVCPLLVVQAEEDGHHDHDHGHSPLDARAVEADAEERLRRHADVASVERCVVHYHDTLKVDVDANVVLRERPTEPLTVERAREVARELRELLETSDDVDAARIYLDLNAPTPLPAAAWGGGARFLP